MLDERTGKARAKGVTYIATTLGGSIEIVGLCTEIHWDNEMFGTILGDCYDLTRTDDPTWRACATLGIGANNRPALVGLTVKSDNLMAQSLPLKTIELACLKAGMVCNVNA